MGALSLPPGTRFATAVVGGLALGAVAWLRRAGGFFFQPRHTESPGQLGFNFIEPDFAMPEQHQDVVQHVGGFINEMSPAVGPTFASGLDKLGSFFEDFSADFVHPTVEQARRVRLLGGICAAVLDYRHQPGKD